MSSDSPPLPLYVPARLVSLAARDEISADIKRAPGDSARAAVVRRSAQNPTTQPQQTQHDCQLLRVLPLRAPASELHRGQTTLRVTGEHTSLCAVEDPRVVRSAGIQLCALLLRTKFKVYVISNLLLFLHALKYCSCTSFYAVFFYIYLNLYTYFG